MKRNPTALYWNYDYPVVIEGDHVSETEAMKIAEHDIGDIELDYGKCKSVKHCWARYQFVAEGDDDQDDYDLIPGKDSMWYIYESSKRPKGVCKKITVVEFDR